MNRKHLISDTQIRLIRRELQHLKQYCMITPDTDASYKSIIGLLDSVSGE